MPRMETRACPEGAIQDSLTAVGIDRTHGPEAAAGRPPGIDSGGEEVVFLGRLENAAVAGCREGEDILRARLVLGDREFLARRRIVEPGGPSEVELNARVHLLGTLLEAHRPAADEWQIDGA